MKRSFPFLRTHKTTILKPKAASHTTIEIKKKDIYISILEDRGSSLKSINIANAKNSREINEDNTCLKTIKNTKRAVKNINENIRIWLL